MKQSLTTVLTDSIASIVVLSLPALITFTAISTVSLESIPAEWYALYSTIALMSATKLYGKSTLEAVKDGAAMIAENNTNENNRIH